MEILSSSSFGCDLDMRPGGMIRSTLRYELQECPACGYVASAISIRPLFMKRYILSSEYRNCGGLEIKSELTRRFYKNYLLMLKEQKYEKAFYSLLKCAWVSDDKKDSEMAAFFRDQCLELIEKLEKSEKIITLRADLLRRTGKYEEVIKEYSNLKLTDEMLNERVKFQVKLAYNRDNGCYTVADTGYKK